METYSHVVMMIFLIPLWIYKTVSELRQIWGLRLDYFTSLFNFLDILQLGLTFTILLAHWTSAITISLETLRLLAAYDTILLWFKCLETLTVFERPAFYVRLVLITLG